MAERKAQNKYYPPEWTPQKGSINKFVGQHPLRDRARKLSEGILIIRFELPYNIWCDGCSNHIGMGVRYNAQKKKVGQYYSTPIYNFRMKCHLCDNWFEIQTDPQGRDYVIVAGAKRKVETWDAADSETPVVPDAEDQTKLAENAFYRAEHGAEDEEKAKAKAPSLEQLLELRQQDWSDSFSLSQKMRKTLRAEKKVIESEEADAAAVAEKGSLAIPILPRSIEDTLNAKRVLFRNAKDNFQEQFKLKQLKVKASSIFSKDQPGAPPIKRIRTENKSSSLTKAPSTAVVLASSPLTSKLSTQLDTEPALKKTPSELVVLSRTNGIDPRNFRLLDSGKKSLDDQASFLKGAVKVNSISNRPVAQLVSEDYADED